MTGPAAAPDTIAAVATPPGRGGIGIVRISGPMVRAIAGSMLGAVPRPRLATFTRILNADGQPLDQGIALFFPGPRSFTGEDVLELHGHGGPVVLDMLVAAALAVGARLARPGEFSERAFLNGKLDLTQAEAIADLIDSGSRQAARAALRSLRGEFSRRVDTQLQYLIRLRTYVEAALDFPEDEVDFFDNTALRQGLEASLAALGRLSTEARQGQVLKDGLSVVIAGRPNVGKSSLLNCLARDDCAIVTEIPGTTRDVIRREIAIDGLPVHVTDTAGLRVTGDPIEQEGIRRAETAIESADLVLFVVEHAGALMEADREILKRLPEGCRVTVVRNKIDLADVPPDSVRTEHGTEIFVSAKTRAGIDLLEAHIKDFVGYDGAQEGAYSARRRHLDALHRARLFLEGGYQQLLETGAGELVAENLRQAQQALSQITGEFTTEDLLGEIFASFCIGK